MTPQTRTGPGGISLFPVDLSTAELRFREGDAFFTQCRDLAALPSLSYFVDEYLDVLDAPRLCIMLDEPSRTASRAAMTIAVAAELSRRGRSVVVIDGDDSLPDFTRWAGRSEHEGWIDMIRYGFSLGACSCMPLPDEETVRFLGVGSYAPTRVGGGELLKLLDMLEPDADFVLVSVSSGDRGAVWTGLPSLRILCWDPDAQTAESIDGLVQDAALLGGYPAAILTFASARAGEPREALPLAAPRRISPPPEARRSSPVFRRMALIMAALVVLIGAWWLLQPMLQSDDQDLGVTGSADQLAAVELDPSMGAQVNEPAERPEQGLPVGDAQETTTDPAGTPGDTPADALVEPVVDSVVDASIEQPAALVEDAPVVNDEPEQRTVAPDADEAFTREVGDLGWCLHVYSYRSDERLARGLRRLQRRGFEHAVKRTSDDKGLLLRVYVGSFSSRRAAKAALPEALERLNADWGQAVRAATIR